MSNFNAMEASHELRAASYADARMISFASIN